MWIHNSTQLRCRSESEFRNHKLRCCGLVRYLKIVTSATCLWLKPLSLIPRECSQGMRQVNAARGTSSSYSPRTSATVTPDHATLPVLLASSVFSVFTLISLGLASAFFARHIFSTPFS